MTFMVNLMSTVTVKGKQVGGAEYLASYLKKYEKENENTLLVHVGDAIGASSTGFLSSSG